MIITGTPYELALDLCKRSTCHVKVAAVLSDGNGIFSWGWNSAGPNGTGQCAEQHAIMRANPKRLTDAVLTVVAVRRGKVIVSKPCAKCTRLIRKRHIPWVSYHRASGITASAVIWTERMYCDFMPR